MISNVASESAHIVLHAEQVFEVAGIKITNSMLLGWVTSAALISLFIFTARKIRLKSGNKFLALFEMLCEMIIKLAVDTMQDKRRALKYAPFLITLFCFILFNNWFGLLPGVGSITYHGVPIFRAWTADLTGTLALSICSIVIIQIYALRELGFFGHLKHYFSNQPWNPINLFVGVLEILGEFTRAASLSLRLFGNVFAGEVLLVVLSSITSYGSPVATLPFIIMELFVGFIQAFVFTMLVIVYLALATGHGGEEHQSDSDHVVTNLEDRSSTSRQVTADVI